MPDVLPSFPPLQNPTSDAGEPWHQLVEGDTLTARNAGGVFTAKDASGDAKYLEIDSQGRLKVIPNTDDIVDLSDEGDNAGNNGSFQTLLTIVLQNSMDYKNLDWIFSCFREATFEMVFIDDVGGSPVETILGTIKVGAGSFTDSNSKRCRFTTGGTGVQHLIARAINLNATSQLEGALAVEEVQ